MDESKAEENQPNVWGTLLKNLPMLVALGTVLTRDGRAYQVRHAVRDADTEAAILTVRAQAREAIDAFVKGESQALFLEPPLSIVLIAEGK